LIILAKILISTVRTETVEYRGYELRATEWLGRWQVSICPLLETLPFPPLSEEFPAAPTLEEALGKARWRVDRLLEASKVRVSRWVEAARRSGYVSRRTVRSKQGSSDDVEIIDHVGILAANELIGCPVPVIPVRPLGSSHRPRRAIGWRP
jgi:hypothetical protein